MTQPPNATISREDITIDFTLASLATSLDRHMNDVIKQHLEAVMKQKAHIAIEEAAKLMANQIRAKLSHFRDYQNGVIHITLVVDKKEIQL